MKSTLNFFPAQPEIEYKMENYVERKPIGNSITHKSIALFYQFKTKKEASNSFSLIPDGSIDLLFCCSEKKPSIFLWTSPNQRSERLDLLENCDYFGVRLFPEQRLLELKYSMRELLGKTIPLYDVMSIDTSLLEQISYGTSFEERIRLFERFCEKFYSKMEYQDLIDYSVKQIYSTKGNINIKQLSLDIGYSDRYLRKKFEESIGFTPKQFSEMVRFQNSLATMMINHNNYNPLDIVYENGYHDQAHFIKGFKKFADLTPTQFMYNLF